MAAVTICSDFGAQKNKVWHCFYCFPIYLLWGDGTRCHIFIFWMLRFKPTFSLSSFTFIKRLFSSTSLSAKRVVLSAYLVIDISPGNLDSSLCFFQPSVSHDVLCIQVKWAGWQYIVLMYSFSNFEPVHCSLSCSNCCYLACIQNSQETYRVVYPTLQWTSLCILFFSISYFSLWWGFRNKIIA